jgi:hypothetical protein
MLLISACQKENTLPAQADPSTFCESYCPVSTGSYWVYKHFYIDSLGVELSLPYYDTITITGDSMIGSNSYQIMEGYINPMFLFNTFTPFKGVFLYKDSSDYLVNHEGDILFSSQNFSDLLYEKTCISTSNGDSNTYSYQMEIPSDSISISLGTFKTLNCKRTVVSSDSILNQYYSNNFENRYYVKDIGLILHEIPVSNGYKRKLIEYHIE